MHNLNTLHWRRIQKRLQDFNLFFILSIIEKVCLGHPDKLDFLDSAGQLDKMGWMVKLDQEEIRYSFDPQNKELKQLNRSSRNERNILFPFHRAQLVNGAKKVLNISFKMFAFFK